MAYVTKDTVRAALEATNGASGVIHNDTILDLLIDAAGETIDALCNQPEGYFTAATSASAKLYAGDGTRIQRIDACVEITEVAVKDDPDSSTYTAWAATDWVAYSDDDNYPDFNSLPYTALQVANGGSYTHFTSGAFYGGEGFHIIESDDVETSVASYVGASAPTVKVTAKWGYIVSTPARVQMATLALCSKYFKRMGSAWADAIANGEFSELRYVGNDKDIQNMLSRFYRPTI